jgi:hypothetical protein
VALHGVITPVYLESLDGEILVGRHLGEV